MGVQLPRPVTVPWGKCLQYLMEWRLGTCFQTKIISANKNSSHFIESASLFSHLQVPATCPYPEPDRSSPCPTSHFLKIHLSMKLPFMPGSFNLSLSLTFFHRNPVYTSPLHFRATCLAHLILPDLITRIMFSEYYTGIF
jgi:hypothetical protein